MNGSNAAAPAAGATYGVLQLGEAQVALSLEALREVIPCPAQFAGLPATAPGLCGAVNLRGKVVPVLDLRGALGMPPVPVGEPVVVFMRHAQRLIGLRADGVRGLTRPHADSVHAIQSDRPLLFSGSFERPEDASVVSVLDPQAVLALPGVPALREHEQASDHATGRSHATRRPLMLVRCGSIGLGIAVTDVHTTLPRVTLKPSCLGGTVCRGVIEYGDVELPAVDPLALLGLGTLPDADTCQALLLRFEQGLVAVLVSQVIDIAQVAEDELLALPQLALRRPECFRAMLRVEGRGEHLVLAAGTLQAQPDLQAMAGMNTRRAGAAEAAQASDDPARARGRPVITFDVGAEVATPLTDVREIVPLPPGRARPEARHPAIVGLFSHRGHAVTLLCLATLLGRRSSFDEATARVLLVGTDGSAFGFVVPRLCHIESTLWEQPTQARSGGTLGEHPLVEVGSSERRRTLPLLDLQALATQALAGEGPPTAPIITAQPALASDASPQGQTEPLPVDGAEAIESAADGSPLRARVRDVVDLVLEA